MKDFSVAMALVDFIPVILFCAAAVILQRDLYAAMRKGAFALFAAGTVDVICAGALKALYKLLYAAGICDFEPLNAMFFPVQSIGFLLAGAGVLALLLRPERMSPAAAAPVLYRGTFLFVGLMVAGLAALDAGLAWLAFKKGRRGGIAVLFALSFVCSLGMGYLSSRDFAAAAANWAAEGVNIAGQGLFLLAVWRLHRAGLPDFYRAGTPA